MKYLMTMILGAAISMGCGAESRVSTTLHYVPDGNSAVSTDGVTKFNRGLYGAHSGFRVDCSDMPEFGIYMPRMGGNLRFTLPKGTCTATYTPGKMDYEQGGVTIEVQVLRSSDCAMWKLTNHTRSTVTIPVRFGGVADKKFSREGDLGVDAADCFELKPEYCTGNIYKVNGQIVSVEYGKNDRKEIHLVVPAKNYTITSMPSYEGDIVLKSGKSCIVAYFPAGAEVVTEKKLDQMFSRAEQERVALASSITITTPDEWINPIGSALGVAADGIWSGEAWLHGSIGWRTPHLGWRGAYAGDALGWSDRALTHFKTYANNQITDIPPVIPHPTQDSTLNLARAEKKWGTQFYSNGYICRRPGKKDEMSHYDMNMVYIDAMLRHFRHTGDTAAMRELFPVIKLHLDWEKRNFDPDGDHLYDAYCCIWASDALYYSAGAVTHSSAYNKFANTLAAQVAEAIGENPEPYRREAEAIGKAIDSVLWVDSEGHWAEYRDAMGLKRLHPSAGLWTIYHAIDSEVADKLKNYAATVYVDSEIPHIPVNVEGAPAGLAVPSTTNWKPYSWSINNVAIAEIMHTALAYWQAGRNDEAFNLMKSVVIDNMYSGASPLNFGQISQRDAARGECYRDFADPIGVWGRALTEGLYGIRPDLLAKDRHVDIVPGFPSDWDSASISLPALSYSFRRDGLKDVYTIENRYPQGVNLYLTVNARNLSNVAVNGDSDVAWQADTLSVNAPLIRIPLGDAREISVTVDHSGRMATLFTGIERKEGDIIFRQARSGRLVWWVPVTATPLASHVVNTFDAINPANCVTVDISSVYNDSVANIFKHEYLSPRPAYTSLQLPKQGMGEWCHPLMISEIDDSGLREILRANSDTIVTSIGIPFLLKSDGNNVVYTSLWDNFPAEVSIPLSGSASNAYLLMAGTTNHMQSHIENGMIEVRYTDGSVTRTPLVTPDNWTPIEQDFYNDDFAFAVPAGTQPPYRMHLQSGKVSRNLGDEIGIPADEVYGRAIPGGAATLVDVKLDPEKTLESLTLTTLSNDVIIGLMGLTLQK
ncbi:MAG: DUF4450 domain-containing protein [Bacteroides sp.]|nr:DUF4450 domain-containing protein [Bacteroides sp.]